MILFAAWILTIIAILVTIIAACIYAAIKFGMLLALILVPWLLICLVLSVIPFIDKA